LRALRSTFWMTSLWLCAQYHYLRMRKSWYWAQSHNDVIQKVLRKARKGTRVTYLAGNHDEALRDYIGVQLGGITVLNQIIHRAADGKRYLVLHGDRFDAVVRHAQWLARLGDGAYALALAANEVLNRWRRGLGLPYWSLSAYLKSRVKNAVEYVGRFETVLADEARRQQVDGVICGHIHQAGLRDIDGVIYANDGDWVESCTALVEHFDGRLEVLDWLEHGARIRSNATAPEGLAVAAE